MTEIFNNMKIIPLRGLILFPGMNVHFDLARSKSIKALDEAMAQGGKLFLTAQKSMLKEEPGFDDLNETGVTAIVEKVVRTPMSNIVSVSVTALERAKLVGRNNTDKSLLSGDVMTLDSEEPDPGDYYTLGMVSILKDLVSDYSGVTYKPPMNVNMNIFECENLGELTDIIAGGVVEKFSYKQELLNELNVANRARRLCVILREMIEVEKVKDDIDSTVQDRMDRNQRDYYLREELRYINEELGDGGDGEIERYRNTIDSIAFSEESREKLLKDVDRLSKMQESSPDANVIRTYLDEVLSLPWDIYTQEQTDIEKAERILEKDHYGLEKVKERFLEMICAYKLGADPNHQIICLIGPPGVGKTSVAKSVAKAMGRKFARVSLGGVNDEAAVRGHRKTYIGAMPGRIINAIKQAGSSNPVILLDEVDKLGADYKGDPSSALLEVLDGEQNFAFVDHYIEIPFDLSKVIFITTANTAARIPEPLYDRMEKINIPGYTFEERVNIGCKYLVKKQMKNYALTTANFKMNKGAVTEIAEKYTREAGVRELEQKIAAVCRKATVKLAKGETKVTVNRQDIFEYLSVPRYNEIIEKENSVGVANGLAWTAAGGEITRVEVLTLNGSGRITVTGNLGQVMKESAKLAVSCVRNVADKYSLDEDFYKKKDIHIHCPEGAVPKDGPSAGVTLSTALLSALTGKKVRGDVAMTGEISLTGKVLPIGGLKEKSMAAYRNKIKTVIIPKGNEPDLTEISEEVKKHVEFKSVTRLSEVFESALI